MRNTRLFETIHITMATATSISPLHADMAHLSIHEQILGPAQSSATMSPTPVSENEVSKWTDLIRTSLDIMQSLDEDSEETGSDSQTTAPIDETVMDAPRRKSTRDALAQAAAKRLYPAPAESLAPIIQYEKNIVMLRAMVLQQRRDAITHAEQRNSGRNWVKRISKMGPWDESIEPLSLDGAPSLPMPVDVSNKDSLAPFFAHLHNGGDHTIASMAGKGAHSGVEPYYNVELIEFDKGVLYADGRVDLCKMVTGPRNIGYLMDSLKPNTFSKHFLLGNNIIGPVGAAAIASFIKEYPDRFETWYLAGNCIDTASFGVLVDSMVKSPAITNVWLKRNPLMPAAAKEVFRLITQTANLRTLDLDQTELGETGVAELFSMLASHIPEKPLAIRHIYLNAVGIGPKACVQISRYLKASHCTLTSLYMSNNPIGKSIEFLADGVRSNRSLERLSLQSCGLTDERTVPFIKALQKHPTLRMLDIGQAYATEDLGMRYNWLTDEATDAIVHLIRTTNVRYLNIGYTPVSQHGLNDIYDAATQSSSLLCFNAKPLEKGGKDVASVKAGQKSLKLHKALRDRLHENVRAQYQGMDYERFDAEERRFLVSPRDVRLIDSVYRNRDAGLARRGLKHLDKWWNGGDETLGRIQDGTFI